MKLHPNVEGFAGEAAESYDVGRGPYPPEVVDAIGLDPGSRVLDLGAGTGLFTEALLAAGHEVLAVEPMADMRERLVAKVGAERALEGTAESIPVDNASVDAATAADAFHWFNPDPAALELGRVIRPGGLLALVWRWPQPGPDAAWVAEVFALLAPRRGDHPAFTHDQGRDGIKRSGLFAPIEKREVLFEHQTDADGYVAALRSFSFVSRMSEADRGELLAEVREHVPDGPLSVPIRTDVWVARRL